jgi:hypothetical protein
MRPTVCGSPEPGRCPWCAAALPPNSSSTRARGGVASGKPDAIIKAQALSLMPEALPAVMLVRSDRRNDCRRARLTSGRGCSSMAIHHGAVPALHRPLVRRARRVAAGAQGEGIRSPRLMPYSAPSFRRSGSSSDAGAAIAD